MKVRILFCFLLLFNSCDQNNSQNYNVAPTPQVEPTLTEFEKAEKERRIEKDKQELKEFIDEESKYYGLSSLARENLPKDDLEIRLWRFSAFGDKHLVFVLKRAGEDWSANLIQRTIAEKHILNNTPKPPMKYSTRQLGKPKSGWETLWQKLNEARILTLPNGSEVGNEACPDCWVFVVETKANENYRAYEYHAPEYSETTEEEQMGKIINTISEEFNLTDFDKDNFLKP